MHWPPSFILKLLTDFWGLASQNIMLGNGQFLKIPTLYP